MKEKKNPHAKVESNYEYPEGYNGAKDLDEQATILREKYQFPLKPLASVKTLSKGEEGLWVIPLIKQFVPSQCEYPYNYGVDFVLERIGKSREFTNWRQGKTGHLYLREGKRTQSLWNQLMLIQGGEEFTPVVHAQFGKKHRGESVDYAREDVLDNEFLFGAYHIGVMLLTHPEREQVWEQLHLDCAGDEFASDGGGEFVSAPVFAWYVGELHFGTRWAGLAGRRCGSASGFVPQNES